MCFCSDKPTAKKTSKPRLDSHRFTELPNPRHHLRPQKWQLMVCELFFVSCCQISTAFSEMVQLGCFPCEWKRFHEMLEKTSYWLDMELMKWTKETVRPLTPPTHKLEIVFLNRYTRHEKNRREVSRLLVDCRIAGPAMKIATLSRPYWMRIVVNSPWSRPCLLGGPKGNSYLKGP